MEVWDKYKTWYRKHKVLNVILILIVLGFIGALLPDTDNANEEQSVNKVSSLSYEVLDIWEIPNGGFGKKILISRNYLNEDTMVLLGEQIKKDNIKDRNSIVQVYTSRDASLLRDKMLAGQGTQAENELYDEHFVGLYVKNANNGYHQFNIFFDGTTGTNQKTISY